MPERSHDVADIVEVGIGSWGSQIRPINGLHASQSADRHYQPDSTFKHTLEALAVHNRRAALVVLLLRDPHLLEGRERSQDRTTDPDRVLSLGRSNDLDLHRRRSKSSDLLLHTVGETRVHGGTARLKKMLV